MEVPFYIFLDLVTPRHNQSLQFIKAIPELLGVSLTIFLPVRGDNMHLRPLPGKFATVPYVLRLILLPLRCCLTVYVFCCTHYLTRDGQSASGSSERTFLRLIPFLSSAFLSRAPIIPEPAAFTRPRKLPNKPWKNAVIAFRVVLFTFHTIGLSLPLSNINNNINNELPLLNLLSGKYSDIRPKTLTDTSAFMLSFDVKVVLPLSPRFKAFRWLTPVIDLEETVAWRFDLNKASKWVSPLFAAARRWKTILPAICAVWWHEKWLLTTLIIGGVIDSSWNYSWMHINCRIL